MHGGGGGGGGFQLHGSYGLIEFERIDIVPAHQTSKTLGTVDT